MDIEKIIQTTLSCLLITIAGIFGIQQSVYNFDLLVNLI